MSTPKYYIVIQKALSYYEGLYGYFSAQADLIEDPELDAKNWSEILLSLQQAINALKVMAAIHQFEQMSKERVEAALLAYEQGIGGGKEFMPARYIVTGFDTWRSLEKKFGVSWEYILQYNCKQSSELVAGETLKIPTLSAQQRSAGDVFVLGDHADELVLGRDLPNTLLVGSDGDLFVLEPKESFQQSMNNRLLAERGELAFYESFGTDLMIGEDYPQEAFDSMMQLRVAESVTSDERVSGMSILDVSRDPSNQTRANINIEIGTICGTKIKTANGQ